MNDRDPANYSEASYWPDISEGCDTLESHVAELVTEEWPRGADPRAKKDVIELVAKVVDRLLSEGRTAPLVDVDRLPGKELMARMLDEIINAPNPPLMACCIDFTLGTGVMLGASMTSISNTYNVTKATVSHHCCYLKETYMNGRPSVGMKSQVAVENYRKTRTGRSSRGPRVEWAFASTFKKHYAKAS
jgi:hypothetical protein